MKGSLTQTASFGPESGSFGNGGAVGMCHVLHDGLYPPNQEFLGLRKKKYNDYL